MDGTLPINIKKEEPSESDTKTTIVNASLSEPSASDTEAAAILTTIKSGEILSLQNTELLASDNNSADLV